MQILNRTIAPKFKQVTSLSLPQVKHYKLNNGIPVYILNGGSQELLKLDLMIKAGALYSKHKLEAPLTALMLNEGTKNNTAHQIAEAFDYYGAYFNPAAEKDFAFSSLFSLNKHFDKTLPVFTDALLQSVFPQKEFDKTLNRRLNSFLIESEKTNFLAKELFFEELFGVNHPYGQRSEKAHYLEFQQAQLLNFYKSHYQPANFSFILSGHITDEVIQLLDDNFGSLPLGNEVFVKESVIKTNPGGLKVVTKADAVQSSIRMGQITIHKKHADYLGLKVLITIFGGYFGSRLMKNIREEKGYTYGIHSMLVSFLNVGYLAIAADVKLDKSKETIDEISNEIRKLQTELISARELELVRNYMMGELLQAIDGPIACSEVFKSAIQFDLGFNYFDDLKNTILNITPEELQRLAVKYLNIDKMTTVVAGKY